jgi:hypothetical protein
MDAAVAYKKAHPRETYNKVAEDHNVPLSTLHDHVKGKHTFPGTTTPRHLSLIQEAALVSKINPYATRGTLLTPRHIKTSVETLCGETIGKNWVGDFIKRQKGTLSSKYYKVQELARVKANTSENRQSFYALVGG